MAQESDEPRQGAVVLVQEQSSHLRRVPGAQEGRFDLGLFLLLEQRDAEHLDSLDRGGFFLPPSLSDPESGSLPGSH